jgi:hypothetical protein
VNKLSPPAKAILDAAFAVEDEWDTIPMIAAALRAAVAHTQQHHGHDVYGREIWECDADELLAIADELEGT